MQVPSLSGGQLVLALRTHPVVVDVIVEEHVVARQTFKLRVHAGRRCAVHQKRHTNLLQRRQVQMMAKQRSTGLG